MRPACHLFDNLAFDAQGRLYVTDSMRATIYRAPPGGGAMTPWFESPYLLGGPPFPIGVNGVRVGPGGDEVYFTVTASPLPELQGQGALYKLPIVDAPAAGNVAAIHSPLAWGRTASPSGKTAKYTPPWPSATESPSSIRTSATARLTGPAGAACLTTRPPT